MIMAGELIFQMYKNGKRTVITIPKLWMRYQLHKAGGKASFENVVIKMEEIEKLPLLVYPEYKREGTHGTDDSPLMEPVYKIFHLGKTTAFPVPTIWIRRQMEIGGKSFKRVRIFVEEERLVIFPKFESVTEPEDIQLGDQDSMRAKEARVQEEEQRDFNRYVSEVEGRGTRGKKKDKT